MRAARTTYVFNCGPWPRRLGAQSSADVPGRSRFCSLHLFYALLLCLRIGDILLRFVLEEISSRPRPSTDSGLSDK